MSCQDAIVKSLGKKKKRVPFFAFNKGENRSSSLVSCDFKGDCFDFRLPAFSVCILVQPKSPNISLCIHYSIYACQAFFKENKALSNNGYTLS